MDDNMLYDEFMHTSTIVPSSLYQAYTVNSVAYTILYNFVVLLHPVVGSVHKVWAEYSHHCQLLAGVCCWLPGVSSILTEVFLRCRASAVGLDWHSWAVSGLTWHTDVVHGGCDVVRIADSWLRLRAISVHVQTLVKLFTQTLCQRTCCICARVPNTHYPHLGMWRSSNSSSTMFKLWTFSTDSKFDECFKRFVVECKFVEKYFVLRLISYAKTARERRQTSFFFQIHLSHKLQLLNVQYNFKFCSVMRYTVLIWTLILLTLGNNILLQSF